MGSEVFPEAVVHRHALEGAFHAEAGFAHFRSVVIKTHSI